MYHSTHVCVSSDGKTNGFCLSCRQMEILDSYHITLDLKGKCSSFRCQGDCYVKSEKTWNMQYLYHRKILMHLYLIIHWAAIYIFQNRCVLNVFWFPEMHHHWSFTWKFCPLKMPTKKCISLISILLKSNKKITRKTRISLRQQRKDFCDLKMWNSKALNKKYLAIWPLAYVIAL